MVKAAAAERHMIYITGNIPSMSAELVISLPQQRNGRIKQDGLPETVQIAITEASIAATCVQNAPAAFRQPALEDLVLVFIQAKAGCTIPEFSVGTALLRGGPVGILLHL